MKRKRFLTTIMAAIPMFAVAKINKLMAGNVKPFKVNAGKSRFGEMLTFHGINTQDIKISKKDTGNQLSILEYTESKK